MILALTGCGGGGNDGGGFASCGNGIVDDGEECDDGNLNDQDACLATCVFNVCGDTFLNAGVEQCDDVAFGGATCSSLGFAGGMLACTASCTFDTSRCTGSPGQSTPTPTVETTPTGAGSPTPSIGSPIATPTPAGLLCNAGEHVVARASVDKPYGGLSVRLGYPSAVNVPGSGTAQSVKDRVVFAHPGGLTAVNDLDDTSDGVDDTLAMSVVSSDESPAGLYVTVTFDCVAGEARPGPPDFACVVQSASMPDGTEITDETCSVTVE